MKNYSVQITVFFSGAVVMIFELVGPRVLGPYFGTSSFIWTSLIGVILGSLSIGYYLGGMLADKKAETKILSLILFLAAIAMTLSYFSKETVLSILQTSGGDLRVRSVNASVLLFLPTSVLLGMVSPYAAKLLINDLSTSGRAIGSIYALSTIGSIVGTFAAGFFLIPFFGTNKLILLLIAILVLLSLILSLGSHLKWKLVVLFVIIAGILNTSTGTLSASDPDFFLDIDTQYNRVWIYNYTRFPSGRPARMMGINNENHSSMYLESDELVNDYTRYYHLSRHFVPNISNALMIGGAGYSFPKDFIKQYPDAKIDVIEIDPMLTKLAKKYFRLKDDPRLNIYHEDGRIFLNNNQKKYDVIYTDAFSSRHSIPFHLTTVEALNKMSNSLNDNGIVIANVISAVDGDGGKFLRAEYATFKKVFPQVYLFQVLPGRPADEFQNLILVGLKSDEQPVFESEDREIQGFLQNLWESEIENGLPPLTDDYAPVEYYINMPIWSN